MAQRLIEDISRPRKPRLQARNFNVPPSSYTPSRPLKSHRPPRRKLKWSVAFILVLLTGGFLLRQFTSVTDGVLPHIPITEATPEKVVVPPAVDVALLKNQINKIISENPDFQISVAFSDLNSPASLQTGVDAPYIAASTSKLLTAVLYLSEVEAGKRTLNEIIGSGQAKTQLKLMIEDSDNPSWKSFNAILTDEKLNEYAKKVGLKNYSSLDNLCTPADIATLLRRLYKGELLNKANTNFLLSLLQNTSENQYIAAVLPAGVKVYHKAGYLDDRAHDAAIVDDGKQPFTLVIFTKVDAGYDFTLGAQIFHEITKTVLEAYK